MEKTRLSEAIVKSHLIICGMKDWGKDYPTARTQLDITRTKLLYTYLITVRNCVNALLQDVGIAITEHVAKEGGVDEDFLSFIEEEN